MSKPLLCFVFCLFAVVAMQAQTDSTTIHSYTDKMAYSLNFSTDIEEYYIGDGEQQVHLENNNAIKLSVHFNYEWMSFSYGFAPSFLPGNDDDEDKGESKLSDYKMNLYPGRLVQSLHYRRVKGFYVENTAELIGVDTDMYIVFPSFKSIVWGGSTGYVLNPEFSIRSVLNQQEWQTQSVGSLVPQLSYDFTKLTNRYEGELFDDLDLEIDYTKENQIDIDLQLAYFYNWAVSPRFIVSPYAYVGAGPRFISYESEVEEEKDTFFVKKYGGGAQLSYNTPRFFMGASSSFIGKQYKTNANDVTINNWFGALYIGYRFDPPAFLKQLGEKM